MRLFVVVQRRCGLFLELEVRGPATASALGHWMCAADEALLGCVIEVVTLVGSPK